MKNVRIRMRNLKTLMMNTSELMRYVKTLRMDAGNSFPTSILFLITILTFSSCENQSIDNTKTNLDTNNDVIIEENCAIAKNFSNYNLTDNVVSAPGHTGEKFLDAGCAINGVSGGNATVGSTDVYSLASEGEAASIILEWINKKVMNLAGADFIVFENVFNIIDSENRFMDPAVVEVSRNLQSWCGFSPDYSYSDETVYSANPVYWKNFAGTAPSLWNTALDNYSNEELFYDADNNSEPDTAGGNSFDLDDLSVSEDCTNENIFTIQSEGFYYIKISSASAILNSDTGVNFISSDFSNGSDIDGVLARTLTVR